MNILTPEMMSKCDQETIKAGYPEILLMEAAAYGTADFAAEIIKEEILKTAKLNQKERNKFKIIILVGKGNNGGDGLAAARILKNWGYQPEIILNTDHVKLSGINKKNFELALLNEINYYEFENLERKDFLRLLEKSDLIIDSLLGTGIKGELRGNSKKMISLINQDLAEQPLTLAVDIPSGINGEDGSTAGMALKADYTATMAAYKRGLLLYPGRDYTGRVKVINIGISSETIKNNGDNLKVFNKEEALKLLPERINDGHKGSFGKVALLAGSKGMTGAPLLSAEAALRTGSGLVYLLTGEEIEPVTTSQLKELLGIALPSEDGVIKADALAQIIDFSKKVDLLAAGPGLTAAPAVAEVMKGILKSLKLPLVLDADALNSIDDLNYFRNYQGEILLTPHPGEMSRLIDKSIEEINNNRIETAREFAAEHQVNIILKGAATVTAAPDGRAYINSSGCNGMATAGSGDVLTGITASLIGQGMDIFEAAALGVYVHGRAGEYAAEKMSNYALTAGDIISNLAEVWKNLKSNSN